MTKVFLRCHVPFMGLSYVGLTSKRQISDKEALVTAIQEV